MSLAFDPVGKVCKVHVTASVETATLRTEADDVTNLLSAYIIACHSLEAGKVL
jgi:hypothetical protein